MAKKEVIYQGLSDLNVLIDDTTANSPDYFRVTNLPGEFTAGINIFKFKGNPALFPEGSSVYIEVLDANGLPVYYEIGLDLESQEQSAIISVYINEDTVPGNGSITICGQANQSSSGQILDPSEINVRWSTPVYIDISKRNVDDIIFDALPEVTITATTGSYSNLQYGTGVPSPTKEEAEPWYNISYIYRNGEATLYTSSFSNPAFPEGATNTTLLIYYGDITDDNQRTNDEISYSSAAFTSSISSYSGSGIAYLTDPIIFQVNNSSEQHIVQSGIIGYMDVVYDKPVKPGSSIPTENTHNIAIVQFSGLQPQIGEIAKIRSYYKSAGVQEYIFSNETDISDLADEFGFTANTVTASFALPTIHRNDKFDFKFEFINPSGYVSKQVLEYRNVLFQGGNTYIGGDDNLITGSLYVAGATGTGVHISGKGNAAMIRSIGYEGFTKAIGIGGKGGFVIYSGSVQPLLNATENYSGVGLELVANSGSYFKYKTANGGLLDIRTDSFFLGSANQFISGANGNIEISSSNFHLDVNGDVDMSGDINAVNGIFQNATIIGFVITGSNTAYEKASGLSSAFLLESWFTSSFVRNRASGNSTAALETKFNTGNTFNYGIFGWTASVNLVNSNTGSSNPLGYGYNVAAATYGGGGIGMASAGGWESTYVNPGSPPGFLKWKDASALTPTQDFGEEYNGYGNEITASFLGGYTGKVCPTVDTIVFTSPTVSSYTPFSITSSLIQIPSASLGYVPEAASSFGWNTNPIGLQFAMRMQSGSEGAGGIKAPWAANAIYKNFWVQCEILDDANNILLTDRRYVYGAEDWQVFNIPLTPALAETISGTITINNPFRIVISWMHSDLTDTGGRPFYQTITNLVRITELRLVQLPVTLGLKTDSLQFADSFFTSGNSGTQHFGSIYPTTNNTYDLGIDTNQWKTIKSLTGSLGKLALSDGIINSKTDVGYLEEPDSLVVYDGTSHLSPTHVPAYNAALVVNYDGDTSLANNVAVNAYTGYQYSTYNGSSVIGFIAGNLFVSGTLEYSHPMGSRINQFNGEVTQIGRNLGFNPGGNSGDIYFLKYQNLGPGPAFLTAIWERASANEISGSGMLAIGKIGIGAVGLRGIARFTGSGYDSLTSASGVFPGDKLYLSTTPGKFQTWAPTGSGEIVRIIGYCFNDGSTYSYITGSALYFAPETSWIENV